MYGQQTRYIVIKSWNGIPYYGKHEWTTVTDNMVKTHNYSFEWTKSNILYDYIMSEREK